MFCPKCGSEIEDGNVFCTECGTGIEQPVVELRMPEVQVPPIAPKKKKKGKGLIIGLGCVLVLVIVVATAFVVLGGTDTIRAKHQLSLGNNYLDEMEYERAIAAFEQAIEIDPSLAESYIGLAEAYIGLKEYDKAFEVLEEGLEATDDDPAIEDYLEDLKDQLVSFTGHVLLTDLDLDNSNNKPLEGIHVEINGKKKASCDTDEDGFFEFEYLPKGKYDITFSGDGLVEYTASFDSKSGLQKLEVILEPDSYAQMYGNVVIADADLNYGNNAVLREGTVELHKLTGSNPYSAKVETDENGQYVFDGVVMGVYDLIVSADGYQKTEQTVLVYEGQTACYNVVLEVISDEWEGKGTASGRVYDALTGEGVPELTLKFRAGISNLNGDVLATAKTDDYGYYISPELESGNYTIEVIDEVRKGDDCYLGSMMNVKVLGGIDISNQDGTVSTQILSGQLRIVMSWGNTPSDLDSHLFCKLDNGAFYHIFYSDQTFWLEENRIADLDLDDTDYYGPETTTVYIPEDGTYTFGVYDFSHNSSRDLVESGATVQVYLENSTIPSYVFYVPNLNGYYWEVFTYDSRTKQLLPINQMLNDISESSGYAVNDIPYDDYTEPEYDWESSWEFDLDLVGNVAYILQDVVWGQGYIDSSNRKVRRLLEQMEDGILLSELDGDDELTRALEEYAGCALTEFNNNICSVEDGQILIRVSREQIYVEIEGTDIFYFIDN